MNYNLIEREHEVILQTYKRLPLVIKSAEGSRIFTNDGDEYIDFLAGIAVNALGHSHPAIITAVTEQIGKYMHISNYFYQEPQIKLAEKLIEISGFDKVFYSNSGTEATEGALKLARRWGKTNNKTDIIGFSGGFHGRTYGALSVMDKPLYKQDMEPFLTHTKVISYNDPEKLEHTINEHTAAIILEFIQGEGGISSVSAEFCNKIIELKSKYGFLIIADEVQAGSGRTGKFFGFEHFNVKPDIITLAKGIGGGLPLGVLFVSKELSGIFEKGMHGTTYGGNAVACASGLAVINELQNGLMDQVTINGNYLKEKLNQIKSRFSEQVLEVRGIGLLQGLLLNFDAQILVNKLLEKKVITNAASGTVLRLVPPLIISKEDIDLFIGRLSDSLIELS